MNEQTKTNRQIKKTNIKKYFLFTILAIVILGGLGYATTVITDSGSSFGGNLNLSGNLSFNRIQIDYNGAMDSQYWNYIKYGNITNNSQTNEDLFTLEANTYAPNNTDKHTAGAYGVRGIVSRMNTYDYNDVSSIYSVWNDFGGSLGANAYFYIFENPCNSTYANCTGFVAQSTDYRAKKGLVVRFREVQRANNKIGISIENADQNNNSLQAALGIDGNTMDNTVGAWTRGIDANPQGLTNYTTAFIDARGNIITNASITSSSITSARSISTNSFTANSLSTNATVAQINTANNLNSNQAGLLIYNSGTAQTKGSGLLYVYDSQLSTKPQVRFESTGNSEDLYLLNHGNGTLLRTTSVSYTTPDIIVDANPNLNQSIRIYPENKICMDGTVCTHYIVYNGSCTVAVGSENTGKCI